MDPAVPLFAFDADQLAQVVRNVALNGAEAMQGRGRLRLDVSLRNRQVCVAISDDGPGT